MTTHLGADFDALGATAGALLLDRDARVVFPGSQEAAVRRFLASEKIQLPEVRVRQLRRAKIEAATIVDCSSVRRLAEVGELIVASGCPLRVFDHHPLSADLPEGAEVVSAAVAATCTVLVEELRRRGVEPDAVTAGLLLLGVYEDTGGLTYADTSSADVAAAAWLLERGARLDWVRRYVLRPLEPAQLELLNQLVEGAMEHRLAGARVILTVARPSEQVEEAAYVVHRYAEIFDLPVVVALLEVPPQIVAIARSNHPHVDAGRLLAPFGGGGHATAAAARLRGLSAVELSERLLASIGDMLGKQWNAAALATPHLHTCPIEATVAEAKERMVRLRINAMPVEREGSLVGVVTRQVLDNAISHGLGERAVTTAMRPGVPEVSPDTSAEELERIFMEGQARFVVVPQPQGWGIITRMDLFRRLYGRQVNAGGVVDRRVAAARPVVHSVVQRLLSGLPAELAEVLSAVGQSAAELAMGAYLVGGAVRDVLLSRAVEDVDIVVEGNGIELARHLVGRLGGHAHVHEPFLTAAIRLDSGVRLDVATARTEFYRSPAALPEVETSAIRQDLYRRDFTVNAMAIDLRPERFGELFDFFGGQRDLERKQVRVLHSLSFLDDPTRAIRAVRFAGRLGFEIAAETRQLIRIALSEGVFARLSGERLRDELIDLLAEAHPAEALSELHALGVLAEILPGLSWSGSVRRLLHDVEAMLAWSELEEVFRGPRWLVYLAAVATRGGEGGGDAATRRLCITGRAAKIVATAHRSVENILAAAARSGARPSQIVRVLERADPVHWVVAMATASEAQRGRLRRALTVSLREGAPVSGAELLAAGVQGGPRVGEAVRAARDAVIDGTVRRDDALAFALEVAQRRVGKR